MTYMNTTTSTDVFWDATNNTWDVTTVKVAPKPAQGEQVAKPSPYHELMKKHKLGIEAVVLGKDEPGKAAPPVRYRFFKDGKAVGNKAYVLTGVPRYEKDWDRLAAVGNWASDTFAGVFGMDIYKEMYGLLMSVPLPDNKPK